MGTKNDRRRRTIKRDELYGVLAAFEPGSPIRTSDETLLHGVELWRLQLVGSSVSIALLDRQTNTNSGILTLDVIHHETPLQVYLVGTALGNPSKAPIGSVFISSGIMDISERRPSEADPYGWQSQGPFESPALMSAAGNFLQSEYWAPENRERFYRELELPKEQQGDYYQRTIKQIRSNIPKIASELILSGNEYVMTSGKRRNRDPVGASIWDKFSAYRAYDMEAAGFRLAAEAAGIPWLVVRGASDYGTEATRGDRVYIAAAAGKLLKEFLQSGSNNIATIRAPRAKFAHSRMLDLRGDFRGYMGYTDDDGDSVVYGDSVSFENLSSYLAAKISSQLLEGPPGTSIGLQYTVNFTIAREGFAAGIWAEQSANGHYFGSLSGYLTADFYELSGVWTGTHGEGIRVGRFKWYNISIPEIAALFATRPSRDNLLNKFMDELSAPPN